MRNLIQGVLTAAMLCLIGITRDAGATVTIGLEWSGCGSGAGGCTATGTNSIMLGAGGGQTLRLDINLSHDLTQGLAIHTFSLNFDTDFSNHLNLGPMAQTEWTGTDVNPGPPTDSYGPLTTGLAGTVESTPANAGRINGYESGALVGVLPRNGAAYSVHSGAWHGLAPGPRPGRPGAGRSV